MDMTRKRIVGRGIAVRGDDIDTDRIIPARYLRCVTFEGLTGHAFEDDRALMNEQGQTHPFDDSDYSQAQILFVNKNFGCGSSREHAPQSLMRWNKGIKAIVGESFSEIFHGNCVALGVPCVTAGEQEMAHMMTLVEENPAREFAIDLEALMVHSDEESFPVKMDEGAHVLMLEGRWDTTAELLEGMPAVEATVPALPYWNHWRS